MDRDYEFKIDGTYTPSTLPMERLAAYVAAFARLLGQKSEVHLEGIREGSAILCARVDPPAQPKVHDRLGAFRDGNALEDVKRAYKELDDLLAADNATGRLTGGDTDNIIEFPGRNRPTPLKYGPFRKDGHLEGQIVRIGGRDKSIHIHLRDGPVVYSAIETTAETAKQLGSYLFDPVVRLFGTGTWFRDENGGWVLQRFVVHRFEVLDDEPLLDVIARLQRAEGNEWGSETDPLATLLAERHGLGAAN